VGEPEDTVWEGKKVATAKADADGAKENSDQGKAGEGLATRGIKGGGHIIGILGGGEG